MKIYTAAEASLRASGSTDLAGFLIDKESCYVLRLVAMADLDPPFEDVDDPAYVDRLADVFRTVGYAAAPIIWEPDLGRPDGNHRHLAAVRAGLTHIPAFVQVWTKES